MTTLFDRPTTTPSAAAQDDGFAVRVGRAGGVHVVALEGDLDLVSRSACLSACTSDGHRDVVVDLAELAFMDCAGYGSLVAAREVLREGGGSLRLEGPTGEPLRLLELVGHDTRDWTRAQSNGVSSEASGGTS